MTILDHQELKEGPFDGYSIEFKNKKKWLTLTCLIMQELQIPS
jgi:hypothetical protein